MGDVLLSEEEFEALRKLVQAARGTVSGFNPLMRSARRITRDDISTPILRLALNDVDEIDFDNPRRVEEPAKVVNRKRGK